MWSVLQTGSVTQFHIQGIRSLLLANRNISLEINRNIFERGWFTKTTYSSVIVLIVLIVLVVSQSIWELQLVTRNMKDEWLGRANSVSVQVGNRLNIFKNEPFTQYRTNFSSGGWKTWPENFVDTGSFNIFAQFTRNVQWQLGTSKFFVAVRDRASVWTEHKRRSFQLVENSSSALWT